LVVKVNRKLLRPLLDTGSGYSVISEKLANELELKIDALEMGMAQRLFSASGDDLNVVGTVELPITIKGLQFPQNVRVIKNLDHPPFILGDDFLRSYQVVINYQDCIVSIEDGLVCVPMVNAARKESFVRVIKPVCILPYSIATIPVSISRKFMHKDCIIEPVRGQQFEHYAIQRIVTHPRSTSTVCRVMNFKQQPLVLRRGELVAAITPVDCVGQLKEPRVSTTPSQNTDKGAEPSQLDINKFLSDYGLSIADQLTTEQRDEMARLLYDFRDIFVRDMSELKCLKIPPYKIELNSSRPCNIKQYRLSMPDRIEADRQIKEMVTSGVVQDADLGGALNYNAPLLLVSRRSGQPRLVVDFRKLNQLVVPFQVSLPRIDDLVQEIASSAPYYITQLDLKSSYWLVPIHKDSQPLLTFTNPLTGQRMMYTRAAFGLINSGSYFSHAMNTILSGLPITEVMTYVDDVICIHGEGQFQQHIDRLRQVFGLFRDYNVSVNPSKCTFAQPEAIFCGHRISRFGIQIMNENRTKLLEKYASPRSARSLKRWLAMASWHRKGIKNFAMRVTACREIARKPEKDFVWTPEAEAELRDIIGEMLSPAILSPILPDRGFVVLCDSSNFAVGYAIGQIHDDKQFKVNYYGGHQLPRSSQNWPVHQKEIYACVAAIREHQYLFVGQPITVVTDNCSLAHLKTMQNTNGRLSRWLSFLANFNIQYKPISGHRHVVPDALSRMLEDASDEVRLEFTPDEHTDTEDYILSMSNHKVSMNYELFVVERPTDVQQTATQGIETTVNELITTDVIDCDDGICCVTDAAVNEDICSISTLNPNATPFITNLCEAQPTCDENIADDVFFDCHEEGPDSVNVVTRQSAGSVDTDQLDEMSPITNSENDDEINSDATENRILTDENLNSSSSSGIVTDGSDNEDTSSIEFELEIKPEDYVDDPEFSEMYEFKLNGTLPSNNDSARKLLLTQDLFTLDQTDGLLYRVMVPRGKRERRVQPLQRLLCLPTKYQFYIVDLVHRTLSHPSTERLYLSLKCRYYSKKLFELSDSIAKTCSECQQGKRDHAHVTNKLHKTTSKQQFGETWHLDHVTLCRPTKEGYKHLLVCIDAYSSWVECYPVYTTTSLETAKCLVDLISRHGLMKTVRTDLGTAYVARLFKIVAKSFGFHHKVASSLNPRCDGKCEKANLDLKNNLRLLCERDDEIVEKLPLVLFAMRATSSSVSTISPYHCIHGRPMPLPVPGANHDTPVQPYDKFRVAEQTFLDRLKQQLDELQVKVSQNIDEQKDEVKRAYDKRFNAKVVEFKLGDMVWLKDRGPKAHADAVIVKRLFVGPYFITGVTPCKDGEGKAYFITHSVSGKRFKHSIGPHRLKKCNIDRTELNAKYPDIAPQVSTSTTQGTNTTPVDTQLPDTNVPSTANNETTDTPTKMTETEKRPKTTDKQLRTKNTPLYSPAIAILRQRRAPDGLEFLVKFKDGMREWIDQSNVSPALKADYLIKKNDRVRSRTRN